MTDLELTRTQRERRLYSLEGVGTVRLQGLFSRSGAAESGGRRWLFAPRGLWQRKVQATDAAGTVVGEFAPRDIRRGGALRWGDRELALRPVSLLRERYALSEGERELVLLDGKGWGRRPVRVSLEAADEMDPGLLLFTAFVVHRLAVNASGSSAGSTAAMSGGTGS